MCIDREQPGFTMETNLAAYNNSWYKPGNKLKIMAWYFVQALFFLNPLNPFSGIKVFLLRLFGAKIGHNVLIKPCVQVKYPWLLEIGNNVWVGEYVWVDNLARVKIGDNVVLSQGAMLLCGNHNYKKSTFDLMIGEIQLLNGSWVGAKAVVCANVILNPHAILTVGSVATHSLEENTIYSGNPAIKVRTRIIS